MRGVLFFVEFFVDQSNRNSTLFGRYTREECGLPPLQDERQRRRRARRFGLALVGCLAVLGWLCGAAVSRWRAAEVAVLPALVSVSEPGAVSALLAQGRLYAASRHGDGKSAFSLALALMTAAEQSPRRVGYFGNAARILADISLPDDPELAFWANLAQAGVLMELDSYAAAFRYVEEAEALLASAVAVDGGRERLLRLHLVNTQAYLLARAPAAAGGNPEKALHLAQLLLLSRDEIAEGVYASDSAAFLDTLACAWHAAGDSARALETQAMALGLAGSAELESYLRHYDEFAKGVSKAASNTIAWRE